MSRNANVRATTLDRLRTHRRVLQIALIVVISLITAACGSDSSDVDAAAANPTTEAVEATPSPEPQPTDASEPGPDPTATLAEPTPAPEPEATDEVDESLLPLAAETIDWEECGERLQCATVAVPMDYDDPSLGTLDIAINIHRSADLDARVGYLFINPGGPGVSGVDTVAMIDERATDEVKAAFDVVGFDPRGVGASEPTTLVCGEPGQQAEILATIEDQLDSLEEIEIGNQAAALCLESMGPVALQMGTDEVARDMDEIRKALGAEQISFFGASYGSTVGGWYATLFPEHVRSMVVDGAANPAIETETVDDLIEFLRVENGPLEEAVLAALESCADPECPIFNDGDPVGYWYDAMEKYSLIEEASDPSTAYLGLVGNFYDESDWPTLHESLRALVEDDDPSGFVASSANATVGDADTEVSITGYVNCLDSWAIFPDVNLEENLEADIDDIERIKAFSLENFPLLSAVEITPEHSYCTFLGSQNPPVLEGGVLDGGDVPILVVGNTSDPVTPYVQSEQYANEVLTNGRLVKVSAPQHVVYPTNSCVTDLVHAALIDMEYPDEPVECPPEAPAGLNDVSLTLVEFPDGSSGLVPEDWIEAGPGVYIRAATDEDIMALAYRPSGGSIDAAIASFEENTAGNSAELVDELEINGTTWTVHALSVPEVSAEVRFAVSPGPDGVLILGQATPEEIDALVDNVLDAALNSFTPAPG